MESLLHILICDDSIAVHESLSAYLEPENIRCTSVYDGESALELLRRQSFDLLILDVMLPKMFGTDVCRKIRSESSIPIIMLSARGEESDRVLGLEIGADDYITKPFSPREVAARIRTILKRSKPLNASAKITVRELTINPDAYEVTVSGQPIELTPKEVETLSCLAKNPGRVLSRELLLDRVWGFDYCGDTRAVDTQIKRLRRKLPTEGVSFSIRAIYGVGYKLEVIE